MQTPYQSSLEVNVGVEATVAHTSTHAAKADTNEAPVVDKVLGALMGGRLPTGNRHNVKLCAVKVILDKLSSFPQGLGFLCY